MSINEVHCRITVYDKILYYFFGLVNTKAVHFLFLFIVKRKIWPHSQKLGQDLQLYSRALL